MYTKSDKKTRGIIVIITWVSKIPGSEELQPKLTVSNIEADLIIYL